VYSAKNFIVRFEYYSDQSSSFQNLQTLKTRLQKINPFRKKINNSSLYYSHKTSIQTPRIYSVRNINTVKSFCGSDSPDIFEKLDENSLKMQFFFANCEDLAPNNPACGAHKVTPQ